MSYDFIFTGGRLKCFKIDLDVEAIVYNRAGPFILSEAVFNLTDEKFAELSKRGMMRVDKVVIIIDIVGDNMTIEFLPE